MTKTHATTREYAIGLLVLVVALAGTAAHAAAQEAQPSGEQLSCEPTIEPTASQREALLDQAWRRDLPACKETDTEEQCRATWAAVEGLDVAGLDIAAVSTLACDNGPYGCPFCALEASLVFGATCSLIFYDCTNTPSCTGECTYYCGD